MRPLTGDIIQVTALFKDSLRDAFIGVIREHWRKAAHHPLQDS